jgi:hypothetical protein
MTFASMNANAGQIERSPEVAQALGLFVARWSLFEMSLLMPLILAAQMSQETAAAALSSVNSSEGKLGLVKNVIMNSALDDTKKNELRQLINQTIPLCAERNALMHHLWAVEATGDIFTVDNRKPVGDAGRFTVRTVEEINALSNRALEAAHSICAASGSGWVPKSAVAALKL